MDERWDNHDDLGKARITKTLEFLPCSGRVLDVGCGDRLLTDLMSARGLLVTGIDSEDGIDATRLPYADASYDYVTCFEALEHMRDAERAARQLTRVAKDKLFLSVPIEGGVFSPTHVQTFDVARLGRLFPGAVIEVMDIHRPNGRPLWYWMEWHAKT